MTAAPDTARPPAARAAAVPHNVPLALSSLVGRARETRALAEALGGARLVTITGPGGAGKTRLAREVAAALAGEDGDAHDGAPDFPDGVWWLELAPVADRLQVPQAVAAVLGVRPDPGRDVTDAVAEAVRARRALLVLDNCEHVIDAVTPLVERLLRAGPHVTVLATSREALAAEGEVAWPVPPLAAPPAGAPHGADTPTAAALASYESVQLFVERARSASAAFALTDANAAPVAAICARLDGLPLAVELAAASVAALGVDQVAARLDDALGVLTRGRRTALPRHRTLRAVLDWSYQLLDGAERAVLGRLAVFRGPFTLDAAAAVAAGGAGAGGRADAVPNDTAAVGALGRLVEQSLVEVREQEGETRYRLLETVRQYGLARLAADAGEQRAAADRHLRWAAERMTAAAARLWSAQWVDEATRLAPEVDDLRAAVASAAAAADATPAGRTRALLALRVAAPLVNYAIPTGGWADALRTTDGALGAAVRAGLAAPDGAGAWAPSAGASAEARQQLALTMYGRAGWRSSPATPRAPRAAPGPPSASGTPSSRRPRTRPARPATSRGCWPATARSRTS
jgi:predicted ATPase